MSVMSDGAEQPDTTRKFQQLIRLENELPQGEKGRGVSRSTRAQVRSIQSRGITAQTSLFWLHMQTGSGNTLRGLSAVDGGTRV